MASTGGEKTVCEFRRGPADGFFCTRPKWDRACEAELRRMPFVVLDSYDARVYYREIPGENGSKTWKSHRYVFRKVDQAGLALSFLVVCYSLKEYLGCRIVGDARRPKTSYRPVNRESVKGVKPARSPEGDCLAIVQVVPGF